MASQLTIAEDLESRGRDAEGSAAGPRWTRRARIIAAILFLLALFVPLVGSCFRWDPEPSTENRQMAKFPAKPKTFKDYSHLSDTFLTWFRDHFGFRNTIIHGLSMARFQGGMAFDQQTSIILGKDGWLFYPKKPGSFLADRYLEPFTDAQLDAWQHLLERRYQFCAAHGMAYIVTVPPDKQTIYPEMLPADFARVGKLCPLDQLIDRLREAHSPVQIVDLRPALIKAKASHSVYFKTDTHWNDFGGYAAYPVILDAINRALPGANLSPQPLSDFREQVVPYSGDLAYFINLHYEYREDREQLIRKPPFPEIRDPANPFAPVFTTGTDSHSPAAYIVHDSFTIYLGQFLGPHFSRACWEWTYRFMDNRILDFHPQVVIDEFLERTLYNPVPVDNKEVPADDLERLAEPAR